MKTHATQSTLLVLALAALLSSCSQPAPPPVAAPPPAPAPAGLCEVAASTPDTCQACAQQNCCGPFGGWEGQTSARGLGCLRDCVKTSPNAETRNACHSNCSNIFPQGMTGARAAYECLTQRCSDTCSQ